MLQQRSSRFWLVVGMFLSLNAAGLVWIRYEWGPRHDRNSLVLLDVTPLRTASVESDATQSTADEPAFVDPSVIEVAANPRVPTVIESARITAWLPISNSTSALLPENATSDGVLKASKNFDAAERLLAIFDRPIVDERELNQPLEHAPFHVSPQVAGHWRWVSTNRLALVFDKPLPAGRKFDLTAAVDFTEQTQADLDPASKRFHFETRPLMWLLTNLKTCAKDGVSFELIFNQPVAPADLLRAMVLSDSAFPTADPIELPKGNLDLFSSSTIVQPRSGGRALEATVLTKEASSKLIVRTSRPSSALRIALAANLTGAGADLSLGAVQARDLSLPTAFALVRSLVYPDSFDSDVAVQLYFSRGLSADQERPKVKISPAVENLRVEFSPGDADANSYHAGVVLRGHFLCGQRYAISLSQTILANDGQTLGETSPIQIDVPHRPSELRIASGQGILIPDGNLTVDVQCVNINGVRMSGSKLHANNLAAFLQGRNDTATMRSIVHERQRSLDLPKDVPQTVALDLRQLLGSGQPADAKSPTQPLSGIYRVSVADVGDYWNREVTTVAITDLGLTAKRGRDGWLVWAMSLRSAEPQSGVTVTARSFNNQILAQATTDAEGLAALSIPENHPDGAAWLLTAERNGDLNYLLPDRHSWMIDTVDQSGRAWPDHYEAMLYTERGVYRPGDTVHLTGILRDRLGHCPPPFPLSVKVTRPDGRVVADLHCLPQADQQGVFQVDYPSSETGQTGVYRFDVRIPGAKENLGTVTAQIESFVPIRIAVEAVATQPRFVQQPAIVHAMGRYLFGQPAAGLDASVSGSWRRTAFASKQYPDYTFGDFSGRNVQQLTEVQQKLNEDGTADLTVAIPRDERPGVWTTTATTTVTENGGRSVSTTCRLEVDTAGVHIGVKPPAKQIVKVDEATPIEWVLLNADGESAAPRQLQMSLTRIDYDTTVMQVNGRPVWKTAERVIDIQSNQLEEPFDSASGSWEIKCPTPGRYRLKMVDAASQSATQLEFYASTQQSDRIDVPLQQPEQLDLVLDQSKYRPGDVASVLVRAPFAGRVLLTLEGDRIYDRRVAVLTENSQQIELPIPADARGGLYVSATVIRPIDPTATTWLPHRAYGLARIVIDPSPRELPLKLETVKTSLPGAIVKVRAHLEGFVSNGVNDSQKPSPKKAAPLIHLWAVDEGILLTTRFTTPKPIDFFHKPRKLAVSTSDIYSHLLPDHLRPASMTRIGADAGDKSDLEVDSARRGPVDMPRRTPTVVWHTIQPVGDDGSLVIDLPVPQFTGSLRLMAVAIHGDLYGSTDHQLTVTSPLLVESTWPRCAAPNDKFRVPVKLFNSTQGPLEVTLRTDVSGPVSVSWLDAPQSPARTVTAEPNKPLLQWLEVTGRGLGQATVRIEANAAAIDGTMHSAFSEGALAVRSATPLDSETTVTRHRVGEPLTLTAPEGFQDGRTRTSLAVSSLPSADLNPALDMLIDYPYGCGEQTSSRLYALAAAQSWLSLDKSSVDSSRKKLVSELADSAVTRLWSMQNRNGGLGYWSNGVSDPWISTYVAGAIVAARDVGQVVDPQFISELAKYLESVLDGQAGVEVDANARAFICRILASLDKPKLGWISRLSDHLEFLDAEGRAHLAAAWIRVGRKDRAASVLPDETFRLTAVSSSTGRITSRTRQDAVLLQVLLELDPQHVAIPPLVERLQAARSKQVWMNTLENATAISALARYRASANIKQNFTAIIERDGMKQDFTHATPLHQRWAGKTEALTITSQGEGEFYVVRTVEGLREKTHITPYDRQLTVRRTWRDQKDRIIDPMKLRVGDLIMVEVQISSPDRVDIPNVAIVDALPGGVEIENPRLATSAQAEGHGATPDHIEFLDDRAVLFTTVNSHQRTFRYQIRVTTPGRFDWPPIQASSMYDATFASVHGGGQVMVYGRDEALADIAEKPADAIDRQ
ncbi:MAG: alpha-2-macroglobulin domain protein [Schlesneria sp.]|nr:alpha-2-macroglobulin domain protein [Schlesneria sp.]